MKKILLLVLFFIFLVPAAIQAQETQVDLPLEVLEEIPDNQEPLPEQLTTDTLPIEKFFRAEIVEVVESTPLDPSISDSAYSQRLKVKFTSGDLKNQEKELFNDGLFTINGGEPLEIGDKIIVYLTTAEGEESFYIADTYRLPSLLWLVLAFFILAIALSRWKGVSSVFGLVVSILVIVMFVVPQIIKGSNPLLVSLLGALMITFVSIYLAHGFNKKTTIAVIGTLITLALASALAIIFVRAGQLFGLGSEEAFYVQQLGSLQNLNLQGLLLGGIILGALGVLDDITTAQTAAIYEIKRADPTLGPRELFARGLIVGREHISSLVNTLFLAYAGASLPMFLFFTADGNTQPLWVTLNSEFIAEELVRTLVGSMALMLAVPITTFLAAYYFGRREISSSEPTQGHLHIH